MIDDKLSPCVKCGHDLSERATACPHCRTKNVRCPLCGEKVPPEEDYTCQPASAYHSSKTFHRSCLEPRFILNASPSCDDCGQSLWPEGKSLFDSKPPEACPNCGAPTFRIKTASCYHCSLPVYYLQDSKEIWTFSFEDTNMYAHTFCFEALGGTLSNEQKAEDAPEPEGCARKAAAIFALIAMVTFLDWLL